MSRLAELCEHVLAPLILGGELVPQRPFGARLALELGVEARVPDSDLASRMDLARVRVARAFVPIDTIPPIGAAELTLTAALNDLLVTTHHELEGALARGRAQTLFAGVGEVLARLSPPLTSREALARHATFSRVFEVVRVDRTVRSWSGREHFRGQVPPDRALIWKDLRRVRVDEARVGLTELGADLSAGVVASFVDLLGDWLALSPLTDLATSRREAPKFRWRSSTFSVLVEPTVAQIAERAARLAGKQGAAVMLEAGKALPDAQADVVRRFVDWVGAT